MISSPRFQGSFPQKPKQACASSSIFTLGWLLFLDSSWVSPNPFPPLYRNSFSKPKRDSKSKVTRESIKSQSHPSIQAIESHWYLALDANWMQTWGSRKWKLQGPKLKIFKTREGKYLPQDSSPFSLLSNYIQPLQKYPPSLIGPSFCLQSSGLWQVQKPPNS